MHIFPFISSAYAVDGSKNCQVEDGQENQKTTQLTRNTLAMMETRCVLVGSYVTLWRRYCNLAINYFLPSYQNDFAIFLQR